MALVGLISNLSCMASLYTQLRPRRLHSYLPFMYTNIMCLQGSSGLALAYPYLSCCWPLVSLQGCQRPGLLGTLSRLCMLILPCPFTWLVKRCVLGLLCMLSLSCAFTCLVRHCVLGLLCTLSLLRVYSNFAMLLLPSLLCMTSGLAIQHQWGLLSMLSLLCTLSCCVALYLLGQLTALLPCQLCFLGDASRPILLCMLCLCIFMTTLSLLLLLLQLPWLSRPRCISVLLLVLLCWSFCRLVRRRLSCRDRLSHRTGFLSSVCQHHKCVCPLRAHAFMATCLPDSNSICLRSLQSWKHARTSHYSFQEAAKSSGYKTICVAAYTQSYFMAVIF